MIRSYLITVKPNTYDLLNGKRSVEGEAITIVIEAENHKAALAIARRKAKEGAFGEGRLSFRWELLRKSIDDKETQT